MANSHPGRDGVRVNDDVGSDALAGERHVLQHSTVTLRNTPPPGGAVRGSSTTRGSRQSTYEVLASAGRSTAVPNTSQLNYCDLCVTVTSLPVTYWECRPFLLTSCRYWIPQVPFCPCRLANLSPIWGIRTERTCSRQEVLWAQTGSEADVWRPVSRPPLLLPGSCRTCSPPG